jgi:hypothetical protein
MPAEESPSDSPCFMRVTSRVPPLGNVSSRQLQVLSGRVWAVSRDGRQPLVWVDVTESHHRRRYVTSRSSFQGPFSTDSREVPLIVRSPSAKESGSRCAHPGSSNAHSQPSGLMETS